MFWLAHAWSRIINQRVRGPITVHHATTIAIAEGPLLVAAIPPALVLALSRLPGASTDVVMAAALVVCIAQLFVWGIVVGRAAHTPWWLAIRVCDRRQPARDRDRRPEGRGPPLELRP